jgi:hypothetical protein
MKRWYMIHLMGALLLAHACADDLLGLANGIEDGKKVGSLSHMEMSMLDDGNKPKPINPPSPPKEDNKPKNNSGKEDSKPKDNSGKKEDPPSRKVDESKPSPSRGDNPPSDSGSVNDLFRKKPQERDSGRQDNHSDRQSDSGQKKGDRSPFVTDPRAEGYKGGKPGRNPEPFVTDPRARSYDNNRPAPMASGNLPGLVSRTEGIHPWRWERFSYHSRDYRAPTFTYTYYCFEPTPNRVCYTPYWYYDPCPPFIPAYRVIYVQRPMVIYVEIPVEVPTVYYLERPQREPDAREVLLGDLRRAWIYRDSTLIEKYLRPNSYIAVYLDGQYAYSIPVQDYRDLTRDAVRSIKTDRITFDKMFKRGDSQWVVYGVQEYVDEMTGAERKVYLMYVFEREFDRWYLVEVGSSYRPMK